MNPTSVVLIDDHQLLRNSLGKIIDKFEGYHVIGEFDNGKEFVDSISSLGKIDIVLLDISMPVMNGFETAEWLHKHAPGTKILVLSMMDSELSVIKMLRLGAAGYILKDSKPAMLKEAFDSIIKTGYYSNDLINNTMIHYVNSDQKAVNLRISLTDREQEFLKYSCSELSYREIGNEMNASPRTIENYRDSLYRKLGIKTRVGLVLFAIKEGYHTL